MRKMNVVLLCVVGLFVGVSFVSGHSGGLDSNGGHYNRKTGEYHYHRRTTTTQPEKQPDPVRQPEPTQDTRPATSQTQPHTEPSPVAPLVDTPVEKSTDELVREHEYRIKQLENNVDALRIEIAALKMLIQRNQ